MAKLSVSDREDLKRAAVKANTSIAFIGENRTLIDNTIRYGRGDSMKYLKSKT